MTTSQSVPPTLAPTASDTPAVRSLAELAPTRAESLAPWLAPLRREALERFVRQGIPTTRLEAWRQTNLGPLARTAFAAAPVRWDAARAQALLERTLIGEGPRIVLVNGRSAPAWSQPDAVPPGVRCAAWSALDAAQLESLFDAIARPAGPEGQPLVDLHTALFEDGALVHVARGTIVTEPIQIASLALAEGEPAALFPRVLIQLEEGAQAAVIVHFVGDGQPYWCDALVQADLAPGAVLDLVLLQTEGTEAYHVSRLEARLAERSLLRSCVVQTGARLARNEAHAHLEGEGCECHLYGLYLADGRQHLDNHTLLEHRAPHCHSDELYKGILDGHATAVFCGRIHVHKAAQKTDAIQSNRGLLLSNDALLDSQPQLEIFADDVRCTHGATIGQVAADAVYYLQTRGIDRDAARGLLTYAFANEVLERIAVEPVRARLERLLAEKFHLDVPAEVR